MIGQREEEDRLLQEEIARRDEILREVQRMEERRQELAQQRARDLKELAALEADSSDDDKGINHQNQNEVITI